MEHVSTYSGIALCVSALLITTFIKGKPHWGAVNLIAGVLLIMISGISFGMFSDLSLLFDSMLSTGEIDKASHYAAKSNATAWGFIISAITAAVGANIISAWFLAERPS
ncbi:hypothetical protein ACFSB1_12155 [Halopseudomonas phragmitis]|uniref:hypothetical protein n=1 Tax=Halopseudomonas phragmitis TaxID=1931241 RepID=UPI0012BA59EC|nr:hypothetical protein [Halopseudomonas phragmitis]